MTGREKGWGKCGGCVEGGGEGEGELGEDDVGKEEANQKRKYALARPEALRRRSRAAWLLARLIATSFNAPFGQSGPRMPAIARLNKHLIAVREEETPEKGTDGPWKVQGRKSMKRKYEAQRRKVHCLPSRQIAVGAIRGANRISYFLYL